MEGVVAVFKVNNIDKTRQLVNQIPCKGVLLKGNFLVIDTSIIYAPLNSSSKCDYHTVVILTKELSKMYEMGDIVFYRYFSSGMFEKMIQIFNKLHLGLEKKGEKVLFLINVKAYPMNYAHKKEYYIQFVSREEKTKNEMFESVDYGEVLVPTDYNLNIKKVISGKSIKYYTKLFPRPIRRNIPFPDYYSELVNSLFILKSIIHSKRHHLFDTIKLVDNPIMWEFTIFNYAWLRTLYNYAPEKQNAPFNIQVNKNRIIVTRNKKDWSDKLKQYQLLPERLEYSLNLRMKEHIKKGYSSILSDFFTMSEIMVWLDFIKKKRIKNEHPYEYIINILGSWIKGFEEEFKQVFFKGRSLINSTNMFRVYEQGVVNGSKYFDDFDLSGLFLELKNDEGKWSLPIVVKYVFDDKQTYTYNLLTIQLLSLYLELSGNKRYVLEDGKLKEFNWSDIGVNTDEVMSIIKKAQDINPIRIGVSPLSKNRGFKVYPGDEFNSWKDLVKVPLFKLAFKLNKDYLTINGNSHSNPEKGLHIFPKRQTTAIITGAQGFEILKQTLIPKENREKLNVV